MDKVKRALVSVSDKSGIVAFCEGLVALGVEVISTGGTARKLEESGVTVTPIQSVTGFPEVMDGRVKTLHPAVHGGILARRDNASDLESLSEHGFQPIDLVVVNLYPFQETIRKDGVALEEAVEQIDIGGPTMVRSAAKNHAHVGNVTSPNDYHRVLSVLETSDCQLPDALRYELAAAAFEHTAGYDAAIAVFLAGRLPGESESVLPRVWGEPLKRATSLRYGENPHQRAALYWNQGDRQALGLAVQLQGKALSYNNYIDLDAAYQIARDLGPGGVAVLKHTNPCGAARSEISLSDAYLNARACDPTSAFGGIVATQGVVDEELANHLAETFLEVVLATDFTEGALAALSRKKNLRLITLTTEGWTADGGTVLSRPISGGMLLQDQDIELDVRADWKLATEREPTAEEWDALEFAWTVVRHVKSNAIVFAHGDRTVGVGAGQMSRVDSSKLAVWKARSSLEGTAVASDAFFPFADGVEAAAEAGATAIIQPGGSIRDEEVIEAANRLGLAMVFTGRRHFRH